MKKLLLSLTAVLVLSQAALASGSCLMREVSLSERITTSNLIVEGKVIARNAFWNAKHDMIFTANTIEVYKIFKGNVGTKFVEIVTEGGTIGNQMIVVEPSLELNINDIGVFTCRPTQAGLPSAYQGKVMYDATASSQGFLHYDLATGTATDVFKKYNDIGKEIYSVISTAVNAKYVEVKSFDIANFSKANYKMMAPSISNFSPTTATAGTATVLTINGSGFGATQGSSTVGFKNADDGGSTYLNPIASQYVSWSDTQIQVQIPSKAGTGTIQVTNGTTATSGSTLTIDYAEINLNSSASGTLLAYNTRHIDMSGNGGYDWQMFTGFDGNAAAKASFLRAFDTWRCSSVKTYWTNGSTTSTNTIALDGINIVRFDVGSELPGGVLGRCTSYFSGCNPGGGFRWWVSELDIVFDDGATWQYGPSLPTGSEYDFETVAVHELGHGQQLGHVIDGTDFMHYALANATSNRTLGTNDIAAGTDVHTRSKTATGCGDPAMSDYSCGGSAPVADFSGNPTTICAGSTVTFTDLSTNTPTSWTWSFAGGTPSLSSSQNPTITYNTPGSYNVTLTSSNTNGNDSETKLTYITVLAKPSASSGGTQVSCNGGNNGTATLNVSSGTSPYTFAWSNGATSQNISTLTAGTYTCLITDNSGCTTTASRTVTQPSALSVNMSKQDATCGNNDGTGTATPSGGTGSYTYSWNDGQATQTATGLGAATYTCTVTDANGCTKTGTVTVGQSGGPTVNSGSSNVSCNGGNNGSVSLTVSGGTSPYTFAWSNGATSQNINSLTAGTYTCTVTDNGGCASTASGIVSQPSAISVNMSKTDANCSQSNGTATANASGGTGSFTYSWSAGGQTNQTATGLPTGNYTCTVTDANGCTNTGSIFVPQLACVPNTKVGFGGCNTSGWNLADVIYAQPVANAQDYEWNFVNTGDSYNQTYAVGNTGYGVNLYKIPGLRYGRTYDVRVRAKVGGIWGNFATTCTITTLGSVPLTKINSAGCNTGGWKKTNAVNANVVYGATVYEFNFVNTGLSFNKTVSSPGYGLLLSKVAGLLASNTYDVTIRAYVNGDWSAFGPMCTITTASNYITGGSEQLSYRMAGDPSSILSEGETALLLYPNPAGQETVLLNISGLEPGIDKEMIFRVYDILGNELIADKSQFVSGSDHAAEIRIDERFKPGIYFVDVTVDGITWHEKLVVK